MDDVKKRDEGRVSASVRYSRIVYVIIAAIFTVCVLIQTFFAGIATFVDAGDWDLHRDFVPYFQFLPIVMLLLAFLGRLPAVMRWQSGGLFLLIALQFITAHMGDISPDIQVTAALHPVIA
ncbi:MAG TPA: DUF6220 domain-containing protein, partial [Bacilli bacterium]